MKDHHSSHEKIGIWLLAMEKYGVVMRARHFGMVAVADYFVWNKERKEFIAMNYIKQDHKVCLSFQVLHCCFRFGMCFTV